VEAVELLNPEDFMHPVIPDDALQQEIEQLKQENERLKNENEQLKRLEAATSSGINITPNVLAMPADRSADVLFENPAASQQIVDSGDANVQYVNPMFG
jgi:cell division septum initiation protein DivIVA